MLIVNEVVCEQVDWPTAILSVLHSSKKSRGIDSLIDDSPIDQQIPTIGD